MIGLVIRVVKVMEDHRAKAHIGQMSIITAAVIPVVAHRATDQVVVTINMVVVKAELLVLGSMGAMHILIVLVERDLILMQHHLTLGRHPGELVSHLLGI